ncbi:MAG: hypothetical protein JXA00_03910 [Candidatus Thermoplasmatota archaeon]|nr:hypothetical protein [Candidatus Thermoplasmatota archaeon]
MTTTPNLLCLTSLSLHDPVITDTTVQAEVRVEDIDGTEHHFTLINKYEHMLPESDRPLLRLACTMPLLNYGLFSQTIHLDFPVSAADLSLLRDLNVVFSRDIFVNKIASGDNPYILPEFFPEHASITARDGDPRAIITPAQITADVPVTGVRDPLKAGVLSSGGKDSLLTYGLLTELGATVSPFYMNESGGHWKTAMTAYKYHQRTDPRTQRVWTNVDRFYTFMLGHLRIIRPDHRQIKHDTYPLRLCIFPFYVFSLLPLFVSEGVGNLLLGSEFDDLRYETTCQGIPHYFGVYDQHQDYDVRMNAWYTIRIPGLYQWSALRSISGLVGQNILVKRYPILAQLQRSCHSCHIKNNEVYPCGTCSKCLGVLLYLRANGIDPTLMNYQEKDLQYFNEHIEHSSLKLDKDETTQSFYLLKKDGAAPKVTTVDHVQQIHVHHSTCDPHLYPPLFRSRLLKILEQYTTGYCVLQHGDWMPTQPWVEASTPTVP